MSGRRIKRDPKGDANLTLTVEMSGSWKQSVHIDTIGSKLTFKLDSKK